MDYYYSFTCNNNDPTQHCSLLPVLSRQQYSTRTERDSFEHPDHYFSIGLRDYFQHEMPIGNYQQQQQQYQYQQQLQQPNSKVSTQRDYFQHEMMRINTYQQLQRQYQQQLQYQQQYQQQLHQQPNSKVATLLEYFQHEMPIDTTYQQQQQPPNSKVEHEMPIDTYQQQQQPPNSKVEHEMPIDTYQQQQQYQQRQQQQPNSKVSTINDQAKKLKRRRKGNFHCISCDSYYSSNSHLTRHYATTKHQSTINSNDKTRRAYNCEQRNRSISSPIFTREVKERREMKLNISSAEGFQPFQQSNEFQQLTQFE